MNPAWGLKFEFMNRFPREMDVKFLKILVLARAFTSMIGLREFLD